MCGFAGFVDFASSLTPRESLLKMQKAILHRGPDDRGDFYSPTVGLCHTRLAIIDLSPKAHQPMVKDPYVLVYNGEIYNFKEIREELMKRGHAFESTSDTEVLLLAYKEWGEKALERFNGMFAFCIFDRQSKKLLLARDRLGVKPLYYFFNGEHLVFSSEIKAIQQSPFFRKDISGEALKDYLHFGYVTGKQTIWKNCYRLLPGQYMRVDCPSKSIEVKNYFQVAFSADRSLNFAESKSEVKSILLEEFKQSTVSDVPIGVCISGGVDSNVLISLLSKELGLKLKTYSLSSTEAAYDENRQAAAVAQYLQTEHTSLELDPVENREFFLETLAHYDEPIADQNFLSYRLIAREARKDGIKVLLSGMGGDELFLGYPHVFLRDKIRLLYKIPSLLRHSVPSFLSSFSNYAYKGVQLAQQSNALAAISSFTGNCFFDDEVNRLLGNTNGRRLNYFQELLQEESSQMNFIEKIMKADLLCFLPSDGLYISDVSSMMEGVEMRVPYLNNTIVDFALRVPVSVKHHKGILKSLLRVIEAEYIPREMIFKGKRGFYPFTKASWMTKYFKDMVGHYLSPARLKAQGLFNYTAYQDMTDAIKTKHVNVYNKVWNMLIFQVWAEYNL